jgi:hypothetical protein
MSTPTPRKGWHNEWGSLIFDFARLEVRNFLVANATYWLEEFHVDGLRVDGVASMLYLDYSRKPGEWIPNVFGGRENLEAMALLQEANATAYRRTPGVVTIAEESTSWPWGLAGDLDGWARLRLQVEHGVDERHPALPGHRADLPAVPPQPADLRAHVRLQRELRPADQP